MDGLVRAGTGVGLVVDDHGRAHVFLALLKTPRFGKRHLHHFVIEDGTRWDAGAVGPAGASPPRGLRDAALDARGRIHVLTGTAHFVLEHDAWSQVEAPWAGRTGLSVAGTRSLANVELVPTLDALYCVLHCSGKSVGARRRIGVEAAAGYGGAGIYPWPYRPDKLAVVRLDDEGWSLPAVVDLDIKEGVHESWPSGDGTERVEVFYRRGSVKGRRLALVTLEHSEPGGTELPSRLSGRSLDLPRLRPGWGGHDFAVDPSSGLAMLVYIEGRQAAGGLRQVRFPAGEPGRPVPLRTRPVSQVILEPGPRALHLLTLEDAGSRQRVVTHRTWRMGRWSEPVELGTGRRLEALAVGRDGRAFALWRPRLQGLLVGRWVEAD